MSSDFGINENRIDIKVNNMTGALTVNEIIRQIKAGEKLIYTTLNITSYDNELCNKLNKIGITDIRYGTMSHYIGGGCGYTLYK